MNFGQVITAMVTPFDSQGEIDYAATESLINHLINTGTDGLVVAGTTGESPTLSTEEKVSLFKHVVQVVKGRIPVIAGTGGNNTKASIELTKLAEEAGVDAIMLVTPYYNKPSQEGLYQHFKAIAESTKLPIMLYNIPGRSAVNLLPETIIRLAQVENIVAVKEASGNLEAMAEIIAQTDDNFTLYSGDDSLTLPVLAIGGVGVVSVASHIIGQELQEMISLFKKGEVDKAASLHRHLLPLMKTLFIAPNPVPVKEALVLQGHRVGSVRLPLTPLTDEQRNQLRRVMQATLKQ